MFVLSWQESASSAASKASKRRSINFTSSLFLGSAPSSVESSPLVSPSGSGGPMSAASSRRTAAASSSSGKQVLVQAAVELGAWDGRKSASNASSLAASSNSSTESIGRSSSIRAMQPPPPPQQQHAAGTVQHQRDRLMELQSELVERLEALKRSQAQIDAELEVVHRSLSALDAQEVLQLVRLAFGALRACLLIRPSLQLSPAPTTPPGGGECIDLLWPVCPAPDAASSAGGLGFLSAAGSANHSDPDEDGVPGGRVKMLADSGNLRVRRNSPSVQRVLRWRCGGGGGAGR